MAEHDHSGRTHLIETAFQDLDKDSLDLLRTLTEMKVYPAETILVHEGEVEDRMYVVSAGRVVITQELSEGEDRILAFRGPGAYFGEMALITEQPRTATVTTVVETEVLEVSKEIFDQVFQSSPNLARSLLRTVIMNIAEADRAVLEDLRLQHEELHEAYEELKAAQDDLVAKERLERELEIAGEVQRSLLPTQLPTHDHYEFAARFEPARQVGGDFYDVIELPDGQMGLLLADVSDKGAHAAMFMAVTRTLFLTEARRQIEPVAVVQAVHDNLLEVSTSEMFVTALYGVLDPHTGLFRYARAGHDYPLLVTADGATTFLRGQGRFLGMLPGTPVEVEEHIHFNPGDCLVIYSDGVTDMTNPQGEEFGLERLERMVVKHRKKDAETIAQAILDEVQAHRQHADAFDDVALLVMRAK